MEQSRSKEGRNILFPEFELVTEPEPKEKSMKNSDKSSADDVSKGNLESGSGDIQVEELEKLFAAGKVATIDDKQFQVFKKRIGREPEQVSTIVV